MYVCISTLKWSVTDVISAYAFFVIDFFHRGGQHRVAALRGRLLVDEGLFLPGQALLPLTVRRRPDDHLRGAGPQRRNRRLLRRLQGEARQSARAQPGESEEVVGNQRENGGA